MADAANEPKLYLLTANDKNIRGDHQRYLKAAAFNVQNTIIALVTIAGSISPAERRGR
jgi:hypothetical protein